MGRKIPGRKHRGVRDPEQQAAVRLDKIKDKINAPPTNPDVQQVSQSLQRLITLKTRAKNGEFDTKKKKKSKPTGVVSKKDDENEAGINFKQRPNETDRQFLYRVNKICQNVKREAAFENKYGVEIKRNDKGEVKEVVKREKDVLEVYLKKVKKERKTKKLKKKKRGEVENEPPKLTKSQKWHKKKQEKKVKKKTKQGDEFDGYKDTVKFGEIVHAPPTLTAPKKVEKIAPIPRQRKLLLSSMLQKGDEKPKQAKIVHKTIDKKGKRKDLPNALRRQLDKQQSEVINAYKLVKAKKHVN